MRVLTIDNSYDVLAGLQETLGNAGFEVLQAKDGKEGLEILTTNDVDVVLTEISLPQLDGFAFTREVRQQEKYYELPIVFLTTHTGQNKRDEGRTCGGTGWIVKPFNPQKLIQVIHRVTH